MLFERMIRAARLDRSLYSEVERDTNATTQALTVVIIVALAGGIGGALAASFAGHPGAALGGLFSGLIQAILGWLLWSLVTYWVGTSIFGGTATPGEMMRCIGFAQSPGVLGILFFIPCLGPLLALIVLVWSIVAGIIAVQEALDFTLGRAILTAVVGFLGYILVAIVLGIFGLGLSAMSPF